MGSSKPRHPSSDPESSRLTRFAVDKAHQLCYENAVFNYNNCLATSSLRKNTEKMRLGFVDVDRGRRLQALFLTKQPDQTRLICESRKRPGG